MQLMIRTKLMINAGIGVLLAAIIGTVGYWAIVTLDSSMDAIIDNSKALRSHMTGDIAHDTLNTIAHAAVLAAVTNDLSRKGEILKELQETAKEFREAIEETKSMGELDKDVKMKLADIDRPLAAFIASAESIVKLAFEDSAAASKQLPKFRDDFEKLVGPMEDISKALEKSSADAQETGDNAVVVSKATIVIVTLAAMLILLGTSLYLANMINRPLSHAVEIAGHIADGNLASDVRIGVMDETGQLLAALKSMTENLQKIVKDVRESAATVASGSAEISSGNTNLSQRTEEQASSLEETASSMEEMTSTVKQNADNAARANQMAEAARSQAEKGGQVVGQAVSAMDEINNASRKIADIIGTIDGIAFQTNLLALNAAVEAARAGEQGRGFAVVASEVRALAQRSANAAKEIKSLIEDSVSKVGAGSKLVEQSGQTLNEIVVSVKKVSDVVADIAAASNEQSSGIEQVNQAIVQMDEMTQQNAALVEEAAAAGRSLEEQAQVLSQLMQFFKLGDEGNNKLGSFRTAQVSHQAAAHHPQIAHKPQLKAGAATARARQAAQAAPAHKPNGQSGEWEKF